MLGLSPSSHPTFLDPFYILQPTAHFCLLTAQLLQPPGKWPERCAGILNQHPEVAIVNNRTPLFLSESFQRPRILDTEDILDLEGFVQGSPPTLSLLPHQFYAFSQFDHHAQRKSTQAKAARRHD